MSNMIRQVLGQLGRKVGLRRGSASTAGREEGAGFYDALYRSTPVYHAPYQESFYYFLWSVIVDRIRREGVKRVLEIGCGPGQLAAYLLDSGVEQYTGLDFSSQAIEMAQKNCSRGRFVVGDAREPAIHAEVEHDLVICTEVLEHIEDDLKVVGAFRPGKHCLCSVPSFPYKGHVRHFKNASEVIARYGAFFDALGVMTFRSPRDPKDLFFLMDGVRNGHGA